MRRSVHVADARAELASRYSAALSDFLASREEADLQRGYELGRFALGADISILDLAWVHQDALIDVLRGVPRGEADGQGIAETVKRATPFFVESLCPFEMTHRGFRESAIALRHMHERLEAEIKRIAHALHDEAGQLLASIYLALRDVEGEATAAGRAQVQHITTLLGQVEVQLRRLSHELRPTALDDLGLLPALQFLAEGVSMRTGVITTVEGSTEGALPLLVETELYRIVQEALTNVAKHAGATQAEVRVWRDGQTLRCVIRDNGTGFDVAAVLARRGTERGLGLPGIQERVAALGGALRIESTLGDGTELVISFPVENHDGDRHSARG
jgi:signal transduction histidine kinase